MAWQIQSVMCSTLPRSGGKVITAASSRLRNFIVGRGSGGKSNGSSGRPMACRSPGLTEGSSG
eukprot:1344219-Heterocapsa_arctica.AAC.1